MSFPSNCDSCFAAGKGCDRCNQRPNCAGWSKDTRCGSSPPVCKDDGTDTDPRCGGPPKPPAPQPPVTPTPVPGPNPPTPTPTPPVPPGPQPPQPKPGPPGPLPPPPPVPSPPSPDPDPFPPVSPLFPAKNDKNPFPGVSNDGLPTFGLALICFEETREGREVFGCYDERGVRFEYRGPPHPDSTTTVFGNWAGPAPYADDLPVKVKGRDNAETSALDSFSLLYTILTYDYGFHVTEIDREYVARIQSALSRGVISLVRNAGEFEAAMRILKSFQRTGHIFDSVNAFGQTEYATRLGAIPKESKWIRANAEMSYPTFDLSAEEVRRCQQAMALNPGINVEDIDSMLRFMESAGLRSSYPYLWLSQRRFSSLQGDYAFTYLQDQVKELTTGTGNFPSWYVREKNDPFKQVQSALTLQTLTTDLTASILETLL